MPKIQNKEIEIATSLRISAKDRDPNLYYYEIRHDDDGFSPTTIEHSVLVNHFGTIAFKKPLELKHYDNKALILKLAQKQAILRVI